MKAKILLALDGSEPAAKAIQYVANLLGNQPDVSVTLLHVFSPMPPIVMAPDSYETSIALTEAELRQQQASWEEAKKATESRIFDSARETLKNAGFRDDQIQTKCTADIDVAHEILRECEEGGYDTVVMGKRGLSRIKIFLTGSVTEKVVRHAKGRTVWVIE